MEEVASAGTVEEDMIQLRQRNLVAEVEDEIRQIGRNLGEEGEEESWASQNREGEAEEGDSAYQSQEEEGV